MQGAPARAGGAGSSDLPLQLRILLVEDNPVNQKVATAMLERYGYEPDLASDGVEALEMTALKPYDVVFMDVQMPRMDGLEATREIRRRETGERHTWIVGMTAHASPGDRDDCLGAGMDDYVAKPVTLEALAGVLLRAPSSHQADRT